MLKHIIRVAILFCIITNGYAVQSSDRFVIVVDAGSSGSRLYLFSYQPDSNSTIPNISDVYVGSVQPGLSSYADKPLEAGKSLATVLEGAKDKLQSLDREPKTVSISVLGTGGMRLLSDEKQKAIYDNVKERIQSYGFKIDQVQTISGKMEGVYGWLDLNYLMGSLQQGKTFGNIDMGGASTQIAFETNEWRDPDNQIKLIINGKERILYSKTFNGLGLEESRKEMNQSKVAASCYPYHYKANEVGYGRFNFSMCDYVYKDVITKHQVKEEVKSIPDQVFIAYSGAYRTLEFFGIKDTLNQGLVESSLQTVCTHSWEELKNMYPDTSEKDLSSYCANGVYLDDLFYSGYRLSGAQVRIASKVNQRNINWALGAVLYRILGRVIIE